MAAILLAAAASLQADDDLHQRLAASSVEILVDGRLAGSGWIADARGHVITAAHVVGRSAKLEAGLSSGDRERLDRMAFDMGHDLALVRLPEREKPWPALTVAPKVPAPGTEVFVFGSPQFRHRLMLPGRIAGAGPSYEYLSDLKCAVRVVHVGGSGPSGTSGGCWVDAKGRVVANQSGGITIGGHATGVSFGAPADAIRRLVSERTSANTADAGLIVEELTEHGNVALKAFPEGIRGVLGVICVEGGPARKAGLEPRFVIRKVDGKAVRTRDAFYAAVRAKRPGDRIRLDVVEKDGARSVEIVLRRLEGDPSR